MPERLLRVQELAGRPPEGIFASSAEDDAPVRGGSSSLEGLLQLLQPGLSDGQSEAGQGIGCESSGADACRQEPGGTDGIEASDMEELFADLASGNYQVCRKSSVCETGGQRLCFQLDLPCR